LQLLPLSAPPLIPQPTACPPMKKREAVLLFCDSGADRLPDPAARREAWRLFVDTLQRDGLITERQAYRWALPF